MPRTLRPILSFVASALVACAAPTAPPPTLAGTQWQLMAIQSMDDAQGTTRPSTPQHYTVSFGADGRATLRLDCNRAFATWQATPSADGVSGQLMLGPLVGTRRLGTASTARIAEPWDRSRSRSRDVKPMLLGRSK